VGIHEGRTQLYLRRLDQAEATPLPGTEGCADPFFSPDGRSIGFLDGASFHLHRMSLTSTTPVPLVDGIVVGAVWGEDGSIYFTPNIAGGRSVAINRIPAMGGTPEPVTPVAATADTNVLHIFPRLIPGEPTLLFTELEGVDFATGRPLAYRMDTGEVVELPLPAGASCLQFVSTGHLLYCADGALHAVPFDPHELQVTGPSVALLDGILTNPDSLIPSVQVSEEGTLAWVPAVSEVGGRRILLADRDGSTELLSDDPRAHRGGRLSPDGTRLALEIPSEEGGEGDVWLFDLRRRTFDRFVQGTQPYVTPIWSPDSRRIAWAEQDMTEGGSLVWWAPADGGEDPVLLYTSESKPVEPLDFSPDGAFLAMGEGGAFVISDLLLLDLASGETEPLVASDATESDVAFSPDGRAIAYISDRVGAPELFVRPFPGPGPSLRVSTGGAREPLWSRDGTELYFVQRDDLRAASVITDPDLDVGRPATILSLPDSPGFVVASRRLAGVVPDGRFVLFEDVVPPSTLDRFQVTLGWFEELKRRMELER
jgi:serine/threonine-protein kinase